MQPKILRPHQEIAIEGIRASLRAGRRRPVLALPTGAGKTIIATSIINSARERHKRVTMTVPLLNLVTQTFARFVENGVDPSEIGVIQGDHEWRRPHAPIQIASVQTLARRGLPETDFVIVDECHLQFEAITRWMTHDSRRIFIGLSATPWARGMADSWDDLVIGANMKDLIRDGYLSPFRVFVPTKPDLTGIKTIAGDYAEGALSDRMSEKKIVADVVTTWLELAEGRPTLLFAVDRAHAAVLHDEFSNVGVASAYVDANTPREEREAMAARFDAGEIKVICSISTMGTGVDLDVRCIVHARPTKSEIRWVQDFGRGLRTAKGKENLTVLDHGGTALRLGMPTDIRHDRLRNAVIDAEEKEKAKTSDASTPPVPRECPQCHCLIPVKTPVCPNCGFKPQRVSTVVCEDGELTEYGTKAVPKAKRETAAVRLATQGKQAIYSQLLAMQGSKKDGWVANSYRDVFSVWPNGLAKVKAEPTPELQMFIHHKNIRFAKRRPERSTDEIIADSIAKVSRDAR